MKQKFIRIVPQAEIAISGKRELDLDAFRAQFDNDFNTLIITNTSTNSEGVGLFLDGIEVAHIDGNGGVFSFDWEFGMIFNFIALRNNSAGAVVTAQNCKVFVGRSGAK